MKDVMCVLLICVFTFAGTVCNASGLKENVMEPVNVSKAERIGATIGRAVGKAVDKTMIAGKITYKTVYKTVTGNKVVTVYEVVVEPVVSFAIGAGVGVVTYYIIGGIGIIAPHLWPGVGFGITLGPMIVIGAGLALTAYGIYWVGYQVGNSNNQLPIQVLVQGL